MGILNVTPDSFSDGGPFMSADIALRRAEQMVQEGADIIDIGGESTRPGSLRVSSEEEMQRVVPVIQAVSKRFDVPISIDTSKAEVASKAIQAGAEIINDISAFRFDPEMAETVARVEAGVVLMHSRGAFETMHQQEPLEDIFPEVKIGFHEALTAAEKAGIEKDRVVLDPGIGFSKTFEQNLELLARLEELVQEFSQYPLLIGTSRKSFIGKILVAATPDERLSGSLATAAISVWKGARIVRTHDVKETAETIKVVEAIKSAAYYPMPSLSLPPPTSSS